MTSDYIKHYLHHYYRFTRQCDYVATEVDFGVPFIGYGNIADLAVATSTEVTEIEVKISLKDFKADFTKLKHMIYKEGIGDTLAKLPIRYKPKYIIPNKLYFAIPSTLLVAQAGVIEKILTDNGDYGLIVITGDRHYVDRRAKAIHKLKPTREAYDRIARRSSSEAYFAAEKLINLNKKMIKVPESIL